jgi:hypothetical protein
VVTIVLGCGLGLLIVISIMLTFYFSNDDPRHGQSVGPATKRADGHPAGTAQSCYNNPAAIPMHWG